MRARVVSWNVHGCVGTDGVFAPERVAEALRQLEPDLALLQEVGDNVGRHPPIDQATLLARALGLSCTVGITLRSSDFGYGLCTLSRWPVLDSSTIDLAVAGREPRLCLRTLVGDETVRLVAANVHLGLRPGERRQQLSRLVDGLLADYEPESRRSRLSWPWRKHAKLVDDLTSSRDPLLLAGDFNDFPPGPVTRTLAARLHDAGADIASGRTFPSRRPLLRLDRLYTSLALGVRSVEVVRTPLVRLASDHLPLVAELELPALESLPFALGLDVA